MVAPTLSPSARLAFELTKSCFLDASKYRFGKSHYCTNYVLCYDASHILSKLAIRKIGSNGRNLKKILGNQYDQFPKDKFLFAKKFFHHYIQDDKDSI